MNRLNKLLLSFVFPILCLLINVSHAEFSTTPLDNGSAFSASSNIGTNSCGDYTFNQVKQITYNRFINESESNIAVFDTMVESLTLDGIKILVIKPKSEDDNYLMFIGNSNISIGAYTVSNLNIYFAQIDDTIKSGETNRIRQFTMDNSTSTYATSVLIDGSPDFGYVTGLPYTIAYSNVDVKQIVWSGGPTWNGTDYFYTTSQNNPQDPDTPSLPSNAEIASAVQAFYNSDYYKNNKDFSDFIVLYTTTKGNYAFIGHTLGNVLGQVIIPSNYRYQGKLYDQQWWKFYIDENQGASPYGSTYHLYSIYNTAPDVITDDGVGKISELVNLDFSSKSVIVYSTTDYPVRTYVLDETTGDYTYTDGIIEGDQYTYDENLDPTISGYNPLDNFVTVDPSQTIIGDADFEGFANSFEEHKDLFSFTENMQWLVTANNELSNYFLGFIVMCALFITLSRILKG